MNLDFRSDFPSLEYALQSLPIVGKEIQVPACTAVAAVARITNAKTALLLIVLRNNQKHLAQSGADPLPHPIHRASKVEILLRCQRLCAWF